MNLKVIFFLFLCTMLLSCNSNKEEKRYHKNGELREIGVIENEEKEGPWSYYYDDGKIRMTETYVNGVLQGDQTIYWDYRIIKKDKTQNFLAGAPNFDTIHESYIKEVNPFVNGKKHGLAKVYFQLGGVRKENFIDGFLEGDFKTYHPNGNLAVHGTSERDSIVGIFKEFYESGELASEGYYKDNMRDGIWKGYHKTGELFWTVLMEENKKIGKHQYYFPDGKKQGHFQYVNNAMDGESIFYWPNGKIKTKDLYDMNKDVSKLEYDATGKLIRKITYEDGRLVSNEEF